jgi:TfoX/Sxy family transcriptional regulator of competence genes
MAYDEDLAQRIRNSLDPVPGLVEKKMFGGVGFMVQGNMACGVHKDMLMVRVGPDRYEEMMKLPYTKPFDMTGRPMKGWLLVEPEGMENEADLKDWLNQGVAFALSLPPK